MVLKKDLTLYERDEKGSLISQMVVLQVSELDEKHYPELVGEKIGIIPLTRGELKKMFNAEGKEDETVKTDKDGDAEMVLKNCKNPQYTEEELPFVKPVVIRCIVRTVLSESGVKLDDSAGTRKLDDESDEFGKNSSGLDEKKKKVD